MKINIKINIEINIKINIEIYIKICENEKFKEKNFTKI